MSKVEFGEVMHELTLKRGLRQLNRDVHFDMGGKLNLWHPRIAKWQGIFHNGRHLGTMDRGQIPEYDVWALDKRGNRSRVLRVGWRSTLQVLTTKHVPGFDWPNFCMKFGIDYKRRTEHAWDMAADVAHKVETEPEIVIARA